MLRMFHKSKPNGRQAVESRLAVAPEVKVSVHRDGIVFLHAARGVVFSANPVGSRIWQNINDGHSMEQIAAGLSREFDAPRELVERDAAQFVSQLLSEGILLREAA